jgi:ech hydrogenase subunit D
LNYSFDDNYKFSNYRIVLANNTDTVIPSISKIYPTAFLYENEMHDLYGIKVSDMAIDFKGTFYRTAVKTPFATKGENNG